MKFFLLIPLVAIILVSAKRPPKYVRQAALRTGLNFSRPIVIRLPARRPTIRPLPEPEVEEPTPKPLPDYDPQQERSDPVYYDSYDTYDIPFEQANGPEQDRWEGDTNRNSHIPFDSALKLPSPSEGSYGPGTFGSGTGPQAPPEFDSPADVNHPLPAPVKSNGPGGILGRTPLWSAQQQAHVAPPWHGGAGVAPWHGGGGTAPWHGGRSPTGSSSLWPASGPIYGGLGGVSQVAGFQQFPQLNLNALQNQKNQVDVITMLSAVRSTLFNGSSVSELILPRPVQRLANNLTGAVLPDIPDVDLEKFTGRWFEALKSPSDNDKEYCIIRYFGGLTENGDSATFTTLKIYREGSTFGQVRFSAGYGLSNVYRRGMIQMHSSDTTEPFPFWIYNVGPEGEDPFGKSEYQYAIVSNWLRYPVTVLVRDPDKFEQEHRAQVVQWLKANRFINDFIQAFPVLKPQPVSYNLCHYPDSTFEAFG